MRKIKKLLPRSTQKLECGGEGPHYGMSEVKNLNLQKLDKTSSTLSFVEIRLGTGPSND